MIILYNILSYINIFLHIILNVHNARHFYYSIKQMLFMLKNNVIDKMSETFFIIVFEVSLGHFIDVS
jgi:hypothetical protein